MLRSAFLKRYVSFFFSFNLLYVKSYNIVYFFFWFIIYFVGLFVNPGREGRW